MQIRSRSIPKTCWETVEVKVRSLEPYDMVAGGAGQMIREVGMVFSLVSRVRKDKHISQQDLGKGVCSGQQISKLEKGQALPDLLLMEFLLQRLGIGPGKFEIALSLKEYEEIEVRDDILDLLRAGRLEGAEQKLEMFCRDAGPDQPVRQMNRARLLGVLALERKEYEAAKRHLEKAIRLTMGQAEQIDPNEGLLAGIELETLILYAQTLRARHEIVQAREQLQGVLDYVRRRVTDSVEQAKLQAKIAVVLGNIYKEAGEYAACGVLCEEALELLRDNDMALCMPSLFELLLEVYEKTGQQEKAERISSWKEILEQVYAHFEIDISVIDKLYFNPCISQYYLIGETIREERKAIGMSQEELIEGIYQEPATLSRVENGQMPDRKKLQQLMERLGMSGWRYAGDVATEDYRVLELNARIEQLMCRREERKAALMVEQMKKYVDLSIPENLQRVGHVEIGSQLREKKLSSREAYARAKELLRLTYREGTERVPFRNEVHLINSECLCLKDMGKRDEAILIYKEVLERFEKSRVHLRYRFLSEGLMLDNMTLYMIQSGHMEETKKWSRKNIMKQLLNGKINTIYYALNNLIGVEWDKAEKEAGEAVDFTSSKTDVLYDDARQKCLQYVNWAFHITVIFKHYAMQKVFGKFAEEYLGIEMEKD